MILKNTLWIAVAGALILSGCNKDEKNASTPGQPAPVAPPPVQPVVNPGQIGISPADVVYDNSQGLPTTIVMDPLFNKVFSVRNYNALSVPYAPDKKLEGNQWIDVGAENLVHLFAPCMNGFGGTNSCLTNDAAEMRFQFDGSGVLNFVARINQVDYKAVKIPYEFNGNTGYLKISHFFAVSRGGSKSNRDVISIEPLKSENKIVIETLGGGRTSAMGADLVDLMSSKGSATRDLSLRAGFRFETRIKLRYGRLLPQATPLLVSQNQLMGLMQPSVAQAQVPALPPIRVFKNFRDFFFFDQRALVDPVLLVPVR